MDAKKLEDFLYSARWAIKALLEDPNPDLPDEVKKLRHAYDKITEGLEELKAIPDIDEAEHPPIDPIEDAPEDRKPPKAVPIPVGYTTPKIVKVPGVHYKESRYKTASGLADGLIVHYTVSGDSEKTAIGVLKGLAKRGLGCMVMDEDGIIYAPESFDIFKDAAGHAGKSKWNGRVGLSSYSMGMEICNWGKLDDKSRKLQNNGIRSSAKNANIIKGDYEKYTPAQEASLINFCRWAKANNSAFKYENVCGHDEARTAYGLPGDKSDPGASLSMTMPQFRELLLKGA